MNIRENSHSARGRQSPPPPADRPRRPRPPPPPNSRHKTELIRANAQVDSPHLPCGRSHSPPALRRPPPRPQAAPAPQPAAPPGPRECAPPLSAATELQPQAWRGWVVWSGEAVRSCRAGLTWMGCVERLSGVAREGRDCTASGHRMADLRGLERQLAAAAPQCGLLGGRRKKSGCRAPSQSRS